MTEPQETPKTKSINPELKPLPENPEIRTGTAPLTYYVSQDGTVRFSKEEALEYEEGRREANPNP